MVATTKNLIRNLCTGCHIANDNLFTFNDHNSTNGSCVMGCTSPTPTERFYLQSIYAICKFD
jgi:hypothetical protein